MIKDKLINFTLIATILVFYGLFLSISIFPIAIAEETTENEVVEWLNVLNPSNAEAHTKLTLYYLGGRIVETETIAIPAHSRGVVKLNNYAEANKPFGTKIDSDQPIVAQLVHYESDRGHGDIGSTELAQTWYFAEGYVSSIHEEYLTILNPLNGDAHASITFYYQDGRASDIPNIIAIPAHSKGVVKLNDYAEADKPFGTKIESDQPVVAQLAHYEPDRGHGAIGSTELAQTWYFAEGYVSIDCLEFLNILNPSSNEANVDISKNGMIVYTTRIPAQSKLSIKLNEITEEATPFGTKIDSDQPIVAQLVHYESDRGHGDIGSTEPTRKWYFAEGYVSSIHEEYLTILNPLNGDAHASITFYYQDGRASDIPNIIAIPAHSKGVVKLNDYAEADKPFRD
jgi:hypothetical protein